ncbi:MAG: DNA translocase FtsK 4TM domain-containing protein [Patescibacteria group bacterium]
MARRKRKYRKQKKNALDYIAIPSFNLNPDTKKGIFIVFILAFGALSALSLFDLAGTFGNYLARGLELVFGWGKWVFPMMLLALGFFLFNEDKYPVTLKNYFGLFLFVISWQPILHFFISRELWQPVVQDGAGGGYIGMYLALAYDKVLGFWGSLILVIALLLISFMLMFNTSLARLIGGESLLGKIIYPIKILFAKLFNRDESASEEEEDEDEEDEDEEDEEDEAAEEAQMPFYEKEIAEEPGFFLKEKDKGEAQTESIWRASNIKIDMPIDLLNNKVGKPTSGDIKQNSIIIQRTLENFGILVEMGEISVGPTVTQYTFKPAEGVKLARITTLSNDLALALAAHPIRIEAPIPGKSLVGVEVPNQTKAVVGLKEILKSESFKGRKNNLTIGVGKDVSGLGWVADLTKMPHLLVAGATGAGKSVCLNAIIVSLLFQNNPDDLRFIMVDPKRVELPIYNGIPHLLTPVITNVGKTINALKWCLNEMDRRFETLSRYNKRNIDSYNATVGQKLEDGQMPYIIFIIDELADLMVAAARDIEAGIIRLAQMARAVGIHLVLATQRPSVDVITGLIKANMPARIAFSVASGVDSKTILDSLGAEKLLGQGDMLFLTAEMSKPKRLQGAYVSDKELKRVVGYILSKGGQPNYIEGITEKQKVHGIAGVGYDSGSEDDELFEEAREVIINMGKASASLLQRRLSIGYARAARLIDMLEEAGVVGPGNGAKPREILISKEQYVALTEEGVSGVNLHSREEAEEPDNHLGEDSEEDNLADEEEDENGEDEEEEYENTKEDIKVEKQAQAREEDEIFNEENEEEKEADNGNNASEDEDEGKYFSR